MFCPTLSHRQAVYHLALTGLALESHAALRAQVESVLNFLYIIDGKKEHSEIAERMRKYRDWVKVRMKGNMERSLAFNEIFNQLLYSQEYIQAVTNNYEALSQRYNPKELEQLRRQHNFLNGETRADLARKFGFKELYDHVYAESSASVHGADLSDRMQISEEGDEKFVEYRLSFDKPAPYPVLLSNMLQFHAAEALVSFFGVEEEVLPALREAMEKMSPSKLG